LLTAAFTIRLSRPTRLSHSRNVNKVFFIELDISGGPGEQIDILSEFLQWKSLSDVAVVFILGALL
jgi:hypothetical protein